MKTGLKKSVAIIISLIMLFAIVGLGALTASANNPTSGTCGVNLTWEFDSATKTLTINDAGEMNDYNSDFYINNEYITTAPWNIHYESIKTLIIESGVTTIGERAFAGCKNISTVRIANSLVDIGDLAFHECSSLSDINIPNSVQHIGKDAFGNCTSLTGITLPNSITSIEYLTFYGCGLVNIDIPSSVETIGGSAFSNCFKLTSITIPDSVTEIGNCVLEGCTGLTKVLVDSGNDYYHSAGNCIIKTLEKEIIAGCKNSEIPDDGSVKNIGQGAFKSCTPLKGINIPDEIINIKDGAFAYCTELIDLNIPDSVKSIGKGAFFQCRRLTSVKIPNGVSDISAGTFEKCASLTSVYIPIGVKHIGSGAFCDTALVDVYYEGSIADKLDMTFGSNNSKITYATWHYNSKASDMPGSPSNPDNPSNPPSTNIPEANIINGNAANNQRTYDYKTTVTFTANVPAGGSVQWYVNGNKAGTDSTLTVKDSKESYTVKVVVTDINGNQTMDEEEVTIKNGFFDKLIWFFVHLFNPGAYDVKQ